MTKIKVCGLRRIEDIQVANELGLDYIGFVFAKSKRQVDKESAKRLKKELNPNIKSVGVFVNENNDAIIEIAKEKTIDVIQLHGDESEEDIVYIKNNCPKTEIIKAVSVTKKEDILKWINSKADYLLLDNGAGGTGEVFDWSILKEIEKLDKKYFIAGGLNKNNVESVLEFMPYGVDVSGGVESDGFKDRIKITEFVEKVRKERCSEK